ncbi:MAG: preprotein translocase subunit SecY [Clostridia bacterium]|nr:preprotein translocase subunit SecY [Clostridia bacterium]
MLETIRNAWKVAELRKKLIYTIGMIIIFRLGSVIPVPLLDPSQLQAMFTSDNSLLGFINIVSGGAFENTTVFAMSITPYINASIIMQLLCVAIPALERLQKEGEDGRKKIAQIQRWATIVLALIQAIGLYFLLDSYNAVVNPGFWTAVVVVTTFSAGTAFLMWLGEKITEKGIGNGISLIIFAGIVAGGPAMVTSLYQYIVAGGTGALIGVLVLLVVAVVVVAFIVAMHDAERRIPVQYAKRVVGRKMYGGQSTHIPIKVASAGVMPIIFAMSIMSFPGTIAQFCGVQAGQPGFWGSFLSVMSPTHWVYAVVYFFLIIFFTYFYTAIQFNPIEMANNMKKNGGFIPGIRPGRPTSDFINRVLSKITLAGAIFLAIIAVIPIFMNMGLNIGNFAIGGTSLIIVVGVALETVNQLESQMLMRHYKGFLE